MSENKRPKEKDIIQLLIQPPNGHGGPIRCRPKLGVRNSIQLSVLVGGCQASGPFPDAFTEGCVRSREVEQPGLKTQAS